MHCAGKTPAGTSFANKSGQLKVGISPGVTRLDDSVRHPFVLQMLVVREPGESGRVIQNAAENINRKELPSIMLNSNFLTLSHVDSLQAVSTKLNETT